MEKKEKCSGCGNECIIIVKIKKINNSTAPTELCICNRCFHVEAVLKLFPSEFPAE